MHPFNPPGGGPRRRRRASSPAAPGQVIRAETSAGALLSEDRPEPPESFASLGVPTTLASVLEARGIVTPLPIQAAAMPDALAGRDVLGRGPTGSGKTIAFSVPMVAALSASNERPAPGRPRGLVLVPTRELASQVAETLAPLAAAVRLRVVTVFGGVGPGPQVAALRRGVDIVVACPGRLEDLIGRGHCDLHRVEVTVLDEADHMADLGFLPCVRRILDRTRGGTQRLLFSATLDNGVDVLVRRYLRDPVTHRIDAPGAPVPTAAHYVLAVAGTEKVAVVRELAGGLGRSLLFTRTKYAATKLARQLSEAGIPAGELHSNLSQPSRIRNLGAFVDGSRRVLVATDIAARGVHVDDIALVIHVDPPAEHKAYLHRSGRTARAGANGVVVTLALPEQVSDVRALARKAGVEPTTAKVAPGDARIASLVGPRAALVEPSAPPPGPRAAAGRRPRDRSGHRRVAK